MSPEEIIRYQENLEQGDSTFRSNWQDQANYLFPREKNITSVQPPGSARFDQLYDTTGVMASEGMASGLLTNLVPAGQKFFSFTTSNSDLQEVDVIKSHMARATEIVHTELFASNFILQLGETLRSLITFGTGSIYEDWDDGLNFMDWDISRYQILENHKGIVDTIFLRFPMTTVQALDKWGQKAGKSVLEDFQDIKKHNNVHWFIRMVRPRKKFNPRFQNVENMPWESVDISVKDKTTVDEGGYPEFPYQVPRWAKTSGEVHGRGIGCMILPQVKMINAMKRSFNDMTNKWVNPPREVLESFEGEYSTVPGARNNVMELPSSRVDERGFGNFPVGKDSLEFEREVVWSAFYRDAFAPLTNLTGDRRNELEIRQRIQESFRRIGTPISRIESELFTPMVTRCYFLLVRNGRIPPPPRELQGQNLDVVYKGPLSLAQQNSEASASQQWVGLLTEASQVMPGILDNVDEDATARRWGRVLGVNEDDIRPEDEVEALREARQAEMEQQKALEAAQVAAGAYGQTTKAPEPGSAAETIGAA